VTEDAAPTLEARGLRCPVPVARARERLATLRAGDRLDVLGDDPFLRLDMQAFCAREGHGYLGESPEPGGGWRLSLRKGG
jgi:tRNA 2-thiouridine synthesizing protein A